MPLLDMTLCESTLLDRIVEAGIPPEEPLLTNWITIDEVIENSVRIGSISGEQVLNGKASLNFTLLNPASMPVPGQTVKFVDRDKLLFGGKIQRVSLTSDQSEVVKEYSIECAGWECLLERKMLTREYNDTVTGLIIKDVITAAGLNYDGFSQGTIDDGPMIILAKAENVRVSEFLRDVATAGGGALEVGPEKTISFRRVDMREAPFPLITAEPEIVETVDDLDAYCNKMTVKVTGATSNSTEITRQDPDEIAARADIEGGTGIYEAYESIQHPLSSDSAEMARLGISTAFMFMQSRGRVGHSIRATLRRPLLDVGQILDVDIPGLNAVGQYQISRMAFSDSDGVMLFDIEATYTSKRQLNLDSLLKIIQAAKATIVLPTSEFTNLVTFTSGATWSVPGIGTVQVEVDVYGAGAGGGGGYQLLLGGEQDWRGGQGGAGAKTVSFREYAAGTVLTIVIGTGGSGGNGAQWPAPGAGQGNTGTATSVSSPTENKVAESFTGGGGTGAFAGNNGSPGSPGTGTGDYIYIGGGNAGGAGGYGFQNGSPGANGKVIIRY